MVAYKELRDRVENMDKFPGSIRVVRPPIINPAYPGQFNLSFTEHPWLEEFGRYTDFDHDFVFSSTPSCIRWNDIYNESAKTSNLDSPDSWKYLGVFEMSDFLGMIAYSVRKNSLDLQRKQVKSLLGLLSSLGIDKTQIHPSYQAGGDVAEITDGRYNFPFIIPEDTIGKTALLEQGIPEENLIPDKTRDTLLALRLEKQIPSGKERIITPWGYRNEVNVNIGTKENPRYIDIGTFERFAWKPIQSDNGHITGLNEVNNEVSIGAVGLERLCMVANGLERVQDVDYIKPFYDELSMEDREIIVGESLRALHRIYSDMSEQGVELTPSRKKKVNRMIRTILDSGVQKEKIKQLLEINADYQPWHQDLAKGIGFSLDQISGYKRR